MAGLLLGSAPARAQMAPSVEDVAAAGKQFELGRTAFQKEDYAVAAEHFERADGLAPNPKVLELAIRARSEAEQLDRAAMLAVLAQKRYPDDARFADAEDLIGKAERRFARVDVSCDQPCRVLIGQRLVHGAPASAWVLFLPEGTHDVRAGWEDETVSEQFEAVEGERGEIEFAQPVDEALPIPKDDPPDDFAATDPNEPISSAEFPDPPVTAEQAPKSEGLSPTFFWIGAGTTAALIGVSTWSAIDTVNSPGESAVREGCVGQGQDCDLYQQGVANQQRTNLLWGVTAGVGVATAVLYLLTDWGPSEPEGEYSDFSWAPWLGGEDGAVVGAGATGRF